jgi:integrase
VHRRHFGTKPLREINHVDLISFRESRLNSKTYKGTGRTVTTVNRELAYLRRMFNVAVQNGWVLRNPFKCGDALILTSCEKRRERILTPDEEVRLLAACDDPRRSHLKPLLVALLDTGCRRGEMLKLVWRDVDLQSRVITVRAENSKTFKERQVGITERLCTMLLSIRETAKGELDSLVFRGCGDVRNSFATACKIAGIKYGGLDGLTLHCLRHTAATRLVRGNLPIQLVGRLLGHSSVNTTYRYLTATDETAKQATSILESYHSQPLALAASSFVN